MSSNVSPAGATPVEVMMANDHASQAMGIELAGYGEGWACTRLTVRADRVNGHDVCHGGLIFSLADTAFAEFRGRSHRLRELT